MRSAAAAFRCMSSGALKPDGDRTPPYPKTATGLVGLKIQPDWRNKLTSLYEQQLEEVEGIPPDNEYRSSVEQVARIRLDLLKREGDVFKVEQEIGLGQVEELIQMAEDELRLIPRYKSWRVWELPEDVHDEDRALYSEDPRYMETVGGVLMEGEGADEPKELEGNKQ